MKKTDFFVVGAAKAGTTSLFNYLSQNPDIFIPDIKELHFFSYPEVADTYYKVKIISSLSEYHSYYSSSQNVRMRGDLSPSYLYNPETPQRIFDYNHNAKIIIILRNPVERAISHYLMDVRLGYQNIEFSEILENPEKHKLFYKEYIKVSMYYEQVKAYQAIFSPDNLLILDFDDLKNNTLKTLSKINKFLDVYDNVEYDISKSHNTFAAPKNKKLIYFLKQNDLACGIKAIVPKNMVKLLKKALFNSKITKPEYSNEKKTIANIMHSDIKSLQNILPFNLDKWLANNG